MNQHDSETERTSTEPPRGRIVGQRGKIALLAILGAIAALLAVLYVRDPAALQRAVVPGQAAQADGDADALDPSTETAAGAVDESASAMPAAAAGAAATVIEAAPAEVVDAAPRTSSRPLWRWEDDILAGKVTLGDYLIDAPAIDAENVDRLLSSKDYDRLMQTLRTWPGDAAAARDYSAMVAITLRKSLGPGDRARFACSSRVCMLSLYSSRSPPLEAREWFERFQAFNRGLATTYVHDNPIPRGNERRLRVVFLVDPAAIVPMSEPPPPSDTKSRP